MSSDIDYEIDVRGHCTNKITCQATCYQKKKNRKSMSSDIAQMKLIA